MEIAGGPSPLFPIRGRKFRLFTRPIRQAFKCLHHLSVVAPFPIKIRDASPGSSGFAVTAYLRRQASQFRICFRVLIIDRQGHVERTSGFGEPSFEHRLVGQCETSCKLRPPVRWVRNPPQLTQQEALGRDLQQGRTAGSSPEQRAGYHVRGNPSPPQCNLRTARKQHGQRKPQPGPAGEYQAAPRQQEVQNDGESKARRHGLIISHPVG